MRACGGAGDVLPGQPLEELYTKFMHKRDSSCKLLEPSATNLAEKDLGLQDRFTSLVPALTKYGATTVGVTLLVIGLAGLYETLTEGAGVADEAQPALAGESFPEYVPPAPAPSHRSWLAPVASYCTPMHQVLACSDCSHWQARGCKGRKFWIE